MADNLTSKGAYILFPADDFAETIKSIFYEVLAAYDRSVSQVPTKENDVNLLTRRQACDLLGISLPTLSKYVATGKLPYSRIGKKILFDKVALLKACQGGQKR